VTARVAAVLPQLKIGARYRFTYAGKTPLPGEWVAPRRPDVGAIPGETPEGGGCRYISIEIH
jgi:hypothetical protein